MCADTNKVDGIPLLLFIYKCMYFRNMENLNNQKKESLLTAIRTINLMSKTDKVYMVA